MEKQYNLKDNIMKTKSEISSINEADIIGLPYADRASLSGASTYDKLRNPSKTMTRMKVTPLLHGFIHQEGTSQVDIPGGLEKYKSILNTMNLTFKGSTLNIALSKPPSISEQFTNEVSPSVLASLIESVGGKSIGLLREAGELTRMNLTTQKLSESAGNQVKELIKGLGKYAGKFVGENNFAGKTLKSAGSIAGNYANTLIQGKQMNLPYIWKNSTRAFSYDFSVRLYCPNTNNSSAYRSKIVNPLMALIALQIPYDPEDILSYGSPIYVRVEIPGMFKIKVGMINNFVILKGGENKSFSISGRSNIIDITFNIVDVYPALFATHGDHSSGSTLKDYYKNLLGEVLDNPLEDYENIKDKTPPPPIKSEEERIKDKQDRTQGATEEEKEFAKNNRSLDYKNSIK